MSRLRAHLRLRDAVVLKKSSFTLFVGSERISRH